MSGVVSVHLMGGLGNQLFQVFAALSYALENEYTLIMPYSEKLTTGHVRNTYWDSFLKELKKYTNISLPITTQQLFSLPTLREQSFTYVPFPKMNELKTENLLLFGYFQSYKYFEKNKQQLFELIRLEEQKEEIQEKYLKNKSLSVSMHFRFGDYKKIQDCHPLMTVEYYKKALLTSIRNEKLDTSITILYFCEEEDNELVNTIIQELKNTTTGKNVVFEKVSDTLTDWEQMLLMSVCNYNIIANSSFSWWGAHFNNHSNKIVCYPSVWFGPKMSKDVSDLFPEEWIKITA